jgi:hypothetical protein
MNKYGENKTIILVMPSYVGLNDMFVKNLELLGFNVINLPIEPYKYQNIFERVNNAFRKTFLNDKSFKIKLRDENLLTKAKKTISKSFKADYALFIRADMISIELIDFIKHHSKHTVAYHWDGLEIYPEIFPKINLFDDFYVFDEDDIKKFPDYNVKLTTNFYFDFSNESIALKSYNNISPKLFYIGAPNSEKITEILCFLKILKNTNLELNFMLLGLSKKVRKEIKDLLPSSTFLKTTLNYNETLKLSNNADVLVDFVFHLHSGLSLRFYEAISYGKKMITNNVQVKNYDFYDDNNIFIWDGKQLDLAELLKFIHSPYRELSDEIKQKYAFSSWLANLLNITV